MKSATRHSDADRKSLGLLPLATGEDLSKSMEVSGEPTDLYKVLASKIFRCDYSAVNSQMRQAAKKYAFWNAYL